MNWWREQWRREDGPLANLSWFIVIAINIEAFVGPAVVAALGVSFIVPVERWFAVVAVLMGWAIQWRLLPVAYDRAAILIGVATAWIFGAFVAASLLGPVPALVIIIPALEITLWAIGKWQGRKEAAADAAVDAALGEEDLGTPQEQYDNLRGHLRARMVGRWHVDEADVDRLLDEWEAEGAVRGLDRFRWQYWHSGSVWLREQLGLPDDVW